MYLKGFLAPALVICLGMLASRCQQPPEYTKLLELPEDQRHAEFKKMPIEKQIDIYLLSMTREPPDLGFEDALASQGRTVIPPLLERLRKEPEEYRQSDLIYVFEVMNRKYLSLKEEKDVITSIENVVARMNHPTWKGRSKKALDIIRGETK